MILNPLLVRYLIGLLNGTLSVPQFYQPLHATFPYPFAIVLVFPVLQVLLMVVTTQAVIILRRMLARASALLRFIALDYVYNEHAMELKKSQLMQCFERDTFHSMGLFFFSKWFVHKFGICLVSMMMVWILLGNAAFFAIVMFVFVLSSSSFTGKWMVQKNKPVLEMNKNRIGLLTAFLDRIQSIKYSMKETYFIQKLLEVRKKEVKYFRIYLLTEALGRIMTNVAGPISVVGVVAIHIAATGKLDSALIFSALLYIDMVRENLVSFDHVVNGLFNCFDSLERLHGLFQGKINNPEVTKSRKSTNPFAVFAENASWNYGDPASSTDDPDKDASFTLDSISMEISRGSLVTIVGEVGSGKTSLLEGLLGNLIASRPSGKFEMNGTIAYCSQKPWIVSGTVKDNIIFGSPENDSNLRKVVKACGLESDIQTFNKQWDALLGEKGINLSGGQKARVALARAIYSDADIVLLDCPLAELDASVGKQVFEEAILGLLKTKTVMMVTHKVSIVDQADHIIVMEKGRIREQGTFVELTADAHGYLSGRFQSEQAEAVDIATDSEPSIEENAQMKVEDNPILKDTESKEKGETANPKVSKETKKEGSVRSHVYHKYIKAMGILSFVALMILTAVSGAASFFVPSWLANWINHGTSESYTFYATGYLVIGGVQVLLAVVLDFMHRLVTVEVASSLHDGALNSIARGVIGFFETNPSGRILERFAGDIRQLEYSYIYLGQLLNSFVNFIVAILLVSLSNWIAFLPIPVAVLLGFRIYGKYAKGALEANRIRPLGFSSSTTAFKELVDGAPTVKAFRAFTFARRHFKTRLDEFQTGLYFQEGVNNWYAARIMCVTATIAFIVWIVNVQVVLSSGIPFDAFNALAIAYALQLMSTFNLFLGGAASFQSSMSCVERLLEYTEEIDHEKDRLLPSDPVKEEWPTQGVIEFDQVTASYPSEPTLPILKSISFHVHGGEKIGIVGRTGAGKSTITACLFRILDGFQGHIRIDGKDIQQLGLETLRSRMFIILQDPVLFEGTFRSNLDPEDVFHDTEIWDVLGQCGLKQQFLQFPDKLDQAITEKGDQLSLGQKQLFMIAAALLRKPKILVLDESTSAMDDQSDQTMQRVIKECFPNTTVISIAHRLDTIIDYDRVLVLDRGKVMNFDTPEALLQNPDSIFRHMALASGPSQFEQLLQRAKKLE
jgi:ABC-type multidrug transport system fused ATPase/permease subunit